MPVESCPAEDCEFKTNDYPVEYALDALRLHIQVRHPATLPVGAVGGLPAQTPKREKMKRPVLPMTGQSCDPQVFEFFIQKWESFKRSTNIQPNEANDLFRDCLPEDVQFIVHSTYGKDVALQSEKDLIENVKALVVMSKSRVAAVVEMKAIKQQPEERAESFLAKLMSAGRRIGFKKKKKCTKAGCNEEIEVDFTDDIIRDDFIAGLADDEIRGELMKKDINTLDEALKLVTAHEMAKRSQASLSTPESASKISQYKRDKRATKNGEKVQDKKEEGCHGCGSSEHGANFTDRKEKCPAWGKVSCPCNAPNHFKRVCRKKGVPAAEVTTEEQNAVNEWICQIRHQKKRKDFYTIDALSYRDGIWVKDSTKKKPLPVKMVVDIPSFLSLASRSQRTSGTTSFKTHDEECTPDTGATVTCGGGPPSKKSGSHKERPHQIYNHPNSCKWVFNPFTWGYPSESLHDEGWEANRRIAAGTAPHL